MSMVDWSSTPVSGEVVWPLLNHVSMARRSYVIPSIITTGSSISAKVIGQRKASGMSEGRVDGGAASSTSSVRAAAACCSGSIASNGSNSIGRSTAPSRSSRLSLLSTPTLASNKSPSLFTAARLASPSSLALSWSAAGGLSASPSASTSYNCGVGGDLFALVSFKGKTYGLNGSGRSPRALSLAAARADGLHAASAHSITVPGAVDGWERLWRRFGKLPWSDLFKDAIYHAKHGHIPTQVEANMALAATLERLAVGGAAEFYRGSLADDLLRDTRRLGSLLNASDLASHAGEDITPISTTYRGYRVWELQSNSQGLTALEALNVLENFNMSTLEFLSATHLHHMIEATKLAFADRALFSGDGMAINSSKWHRATQRLLSKRYAARLSRTISSTGHKRRSMDNTIRPDQYAFNGARLQPNGDTISIVAGDEDGIMISLMQSNFNSKFMLETLGFVLHNRGNLFSLGESSPDLYAPGSRPFHTLTPALVTVRTGHGIGERPWLAFGMTGGSTQPVGHLQLLTNIIDFGLPLQAAIDAPRFTHWHPNQPSGYWTEPHWQPAGWQLAGGSPSGSMGTAGFVQLEALHPCLSARRMQAIEVVGDPQTHSRPNFKLQGYRVGSDRRG
ncbi:gamma-glutamyl transferase [Emiliania huxleyi CCMP1516]|uniref:Gamma-glutamyltransferase n=2 Tax=Emiliania huxleyi TaxID=2903 RepID=A0A0D3L0N9_EMIH1|nr:gamma-glutamyl transferase [Emiliania huxleyi CCMP1516]EOD41574.1 gamma-glutamyl transferase [Emiliania huxleyi CCMP1516]|eukprot:XP_005794003.1 gamma-glutamyl transferase [Emiliania huxleyi CCMP1516]